MKRNPNTVRRARENRANMPKAGALLWTLLRDRRLIKRKFRRQHTIGLYAVDFACPAVKLVIELDGPLHDEPEQIAFDAGRTEYLQLNGWRVIRFKNDGHPLPSRGEGRKSTTPPTPPAGGANAPADRRRLGLC
jgi:very-short-patch-repair endonuclease